MSGDGDIIIHHALDGRVTLWPVAAENIFGFTAGEALGKHVSIIIPFDWQDEEYKIVDRVRGGEPSIAFKTVRRAKDGRYYQVDAVTTPLLDKQGRVTGIEKRFSNFIPYRAHLFEIFGGKEMIQKAVQNLYQRALRDPLLAPFFPPDKMEMLRQHQAAFLTMAFGGPHEYTGKSLRDAHAPLVARGMTDAHFDAIAFHLGCTMEDFGISAENRAEVLAFVERTRNDVLNRPVPTA